MIDCVWKPFFSLFVACVAGGISVGVLYRFGGGAARRVCIQANFKRGIFLRGYAAKKVPREQESRQLRRLLSLYLSFLNNVARVRLVLG